MKKAGYRKTRLDAAAPGVHDARMKAWLFPLLLCCGFVSADESPITLVIHGGAGVGRESLTPDKEKQCRQVLEQAVREGHAVLVKDGAALEAVQTAVMILEDSPLFNAGRGAVLTAAGTAELDASVMEGRTGQAGAVAGVQGVRHPIQLAEMVMRKTPHVLMIGRGAEELARAQGLRFEDLDWFITPEQVARLERARKKSAALDDNDFSLRMGTVGAVALDRQGNLAAGTSTGGLVNKRSGRVGDSPVIGAGTYAENGVCAVSCTGHGEFFIRNVVAYDVAARMKYGGASLADAAEAVINEKLKKLDGRGGLISVDARGGIAMPFNSDGMFRAWIGPDNVPHVAIFQD